MGSSTQETKQVNQPYKELQPLINTTITDALRAYKGGVGANTTSMVVPWSNQTMKAQDGIMGIASRNANGKNGLNANLQGIINNGGFSDRQNSAMDNMTRQLGQLGKNGLSDAGDRALGVYGKQLNRLGSNGLTNAQDDVMSNYSQLANSKYNANANPGYQDVRQNLIDDTQNAVNLNAAAAGRYGSGVHEGVQAREIGKVTSNMDMNDFNNWLSRRDSANSSLANLSQMGLGNMQGLAQGMAGLGQQGVANRQGLSSGLFNAAQAGQGNMTAAYQGMKSPYTDMMGVGSMDEDLMRRQLDDQQRVANLPWTQLQKLQSIGSGTGNYNTTTTTAPGPNPFLSTIGGVGSGLSSLNSIFSML